VDSPHGFQQCCGTGMLIPDPGARFFSIPDPNFSVPDPGFAPKNLNILTQKIVYKLLEIWSGLFIRDPDPDPGSWSRISWFFIPGSKMHRIPDPQHWVFKYYNCCRWVYRLEGAGAAVPPPAAQARRAAVPGVAGQRAAVHLAAWSPLYHNCRWV
jgi:hypothetical protein